MNTRLSLAIITLVLILVPVCTALYAESQVESQGAAQDGKKQAKAGQAQQESEGERVFKQNCARCHTAPEGFSSNISGTIARHMRVRASLSKHQEQELLRFLNP